MTSNTEDWLRQAIPWNGRIAWWLVLIEGLFALIIGLFMLFVRGTGFETQMIGLLLLVESSFTLYRVFKDWHIDQDEVYRLMRAMVGITTGLITFLTPIIVSVAFQVSALLVLGIALAIGLILEGLIGLWAMAQADNLRTRVINTLFAITFIGLGVVYYLQVVTFTNLLPWLGAFLAFIGILLGIYAFYLRVQQIGDANPSSEAMSETTSETTSEATSA